MRKLFFLIIGVTLLFSGEQQTQKKEEKCISVRKEVQNFLKNFKKEMRKKTGRGFSFGRPINGKVYVFKSEPLTVGPLDSAYPKELTIAYEKAMLEIRSDFILKTSGKLTKDSGLESSRDDSSNREKFKPLQLERSKADDNQLLRIAKKLLDVTENKLDEILIKQGVKPKDVRNLTIVQKKQLAMESYFSNYLKTAFDQAVGIVPVKTKIINGFDKKGNELSEIVVIAAYNPATMQLAKSIRYNRKPHCDPKKARDYNTPDDDKLLSYIGLRFSRDEKGCPMLVAYGRWGVLNEESDSFFNDRAYDIAYEKAKTIAEGFIADFANSTVEVKQSVNISSIAKQIAKKISKFDRRTLEKTGEKVTKEVVKETMDKFFKNIKNSSSVTLNGIDEFDRVEIEDKNGLTHLFTIVGWSYGNVENTQKIIDMKNVVEKDKKVEQKNKTKKVNTTSYESPLEDDF